jgi:hypothetical protein
MKGDVVGDGLQKYVYDVVANNPRKLSMKTFLLAS